MCSRVPPARTHGLGGYRLEIEDMAMLADAVHDVAVANALLGGSFEHQEHRRHLVTPFLRYVRSVGALSRSIAEIPGWVVHTYAAWCIGQGMQAGNMENIFSAIRVVFGALGNDISDTCSNRQLGLPRRARKGARRAQSPAEIEALIERANRIDRGLALMIALARNLGLRRKEALMCCKDLQMWHDALASGKTKIEVLRGSKNSRPREVEILEDRRAETLKAIDAALAYASEHNLELITGRGKTLKSGMNRLKALLPRCRMIGELSFHSLRYTYALDLALQLEDGGVPPYETLVRVASSLGHGPTRTQMILNYYCQPIAYRFKGCLKIAKTEAHRRSPAKGLPRAAARREAKLRHSRLSGFPVGRMELPTQHQGPTQRRTRGGVDSGGNRVVSHPEPYAVGTGEK
jgi:integrase